MDAVFGADYQNLIHIRRRVFCELARALCKKLVESTGHGLNQHLQGFVVGIAKRVDGAPWHENRGLGRNFDPGSVLQELSGAR